MSIYHIVLLISSIIWFAPLFKQRQTKYFSFFLILAVSDPLVYLLFLVTNVNSSFISLFIILFLICSLLHEKRIIVLILGIFLNLLSGFCFSKIWHFNLLATLYLLILIFVLLISLLKMLKRNQFNLFELLLVLYSIMNFYKFLALVLDVKMGIVSFIIGYAFQILFGILFTFINVNTKNFKLNLTYFEKRAE